MPEDRTPPEAVEVPENEQEPLLQKTEKVRTGPYKKLHSQLKEFYETLAVTVIGPLDQLGGVLMLQRADDLAGTWVDLAEQNPRVKQTLERILEGSGVMAVIIAHGALLMPVLANRGLFPDQAAKGIAFVTAMQNPEVASMFTHPRFQENYDPSTNGHSAN